MPKHPAARARGLCPITVIHVNVFLYRRSSMWRCAISTMLCCFIYWSIFSVLLIIPDFRLVGHVIETCNADAFECGLRCVRNRKCWSYNYYGNKFCELNDQTWHLSPVTLIPANGFTYYGKGRNEAILDGNHFVIQFVNSSYSVFKHVTQ